MAGMLLVFLLLILAFIFMLFHSKHKMSEKSVGHRVPPGFPFIGNLLQFDSKMRHQFLWKLSKKYGPLMSLQLGSRPVLVISSAKMAMEALKTHDLVFSSRPVLVGQGKLSYNGLDVAFSPYNEYWKEMRKICIVHLFSHKRVESFLPIRQDEMSLMIQKISKLASSSQLVDINVVAMALSSTVICRVAFGNRFDEDGYERKRFKEILQESQAMLAGFFFADYFPSLSWIDKFSGMTGRLDKNFKELNSFFQELIDEHLNPNRPKMMTGDIIDLLIQLKEEQSSSIHLTWDHIKALLMDLFVAASDTVGAAIIWAMTALMKNSSALKRVQAEIRDLVGKKGVVDEEDIPELPLSESDSKGSTAIVSPAPVPAPRETTERCIIEGYEIESKTLVFINAWAIARDPAYWKNPDDFIPERFLNSNIDVRGQNFEVIPFGAGRRGCPGVSMGLATVELALANLLYSFDWELAPGMRIEDIDTDVLSGLTMHKKSPLSLIAKKYA